MDFVYICLAQMSTSVEANSNNRAFNRRQRPFATETHRPQALMPRFQEEPSALSAIASTEHEGIDDVAQRRMTTVEVFGRGSAPHGPPPVPGAGFKAMTIPVVSLQHPKFSFRGPAGFIPPSARRRHDITDQSPISPQLGWQGPVRTCHLLSALTNLRNTISCQRRRAVSSP